MGCQSMLPPSLLRKRIFANLHQELVSSTPLAVAEQEFSEFRMRWIKRLDARTDDWSLKKKLLESLEDAYLAPSSVLSDEDFNTVKDKFFEGVLSPARLLDELQRLLARIDVNQ